MGCRVGRVVRKGSVEVDRMDPEVACGPMLGLHMDHGMEEQSSCSEDSHHGFAAQAHVCTLIEKGTRAEAEEAAARHGGCMGNRRRTPR